MKIVERHLGRPTRRAGFRRLAFLFFFTAFVLLPAFSVGSAPQQPAPTGPHLWAEYAGNPASIGVGEPKHRIVFTPLQFSAGNNIWPLLTLDEWVDKDIPKAVRGQFLSDMPDEGFGVDLQTAHALNVGYGDFEMYAGLRTSASGTIAPDVWEIMLLGNELNRSYSLSGTALQASATTNRPTPRFPARSRSTPVRCVRGCG